MTQAWEEAKKQLQRRHTHKRFKTRLAIEGEKNHRLPIPCFLAVVVLLGGERCWGKSLWKKTKRKKRVIQSFFPSLVHNSEIHKISILSWHSSKMVVFHPRHSAHFRADGPSRTSFQIKNVLFPPKKLIFGQIIVLPPPNQRLTSCSSIPPTNPTLEALIHSNIGIPLLSCRDVNEFRMGRKKPPPLTKSNQHCLSQAILPSSDPPHKVTQPLQFSRMSGVWFGPPTRKGEGDNVGPTSWA